MPSIMTPARSRTVGLLAVAAAGFGLAWSAAGQGSPSGVPPPDPLAVRSQHPGAVRLTDPLSAVAAIPPLGGAIQAAQTPPPTTTEAPATALPPTVPAAPQPSAAAPVPAPQATPAPAPAPAPAPSPPPRRSAPSSGGGSNFDDSG